SSGSDQEKSWDSEQDKGDKGSWEKGKDEEEKPHGGMHTGGGALTAVTNDDWSKGDKDKESSGSDQEKSWDSEQDKGDKGSWEKGKDEEEKPHGGMHTGGGGLATPGVTAGGIAVLGLAAAGVYTVRRRNAEGGVA
ncbi:hypothetical protein ACFV99_34825, partial [Streptomyces sp. NPDC059944]